MGARRKLAALAFTCIGLTAACGSSSNAAGFPERPMRLIVPFPPAGAADISARIVTQKLAENLQQPIVVENRGGAGTVIGTTAFLKSSPDGYTLFLHSPPTAINPTLLKSLPYDTRKDLVPVVTLAKIPLIVLVNPSNAANTVQELVALSKRKAGGLTYASSGNGGSPHLATEMLRKFTGMNMVHVPYQGSGPAVTAILGGQVDFTITSSFPKQQVESGKVRAIAVTGAKRWFLLPNTPTVAEQGFTGFEASTWQGFSVPRGTPRALVSLINAEVVKVLRSQDVASRLSSQGFEVIGDTPEQAARFLEAEIAKWGEAVKFSGAQVN
ncbi:MAG TPA: tripartite tricarboxylate transporter substrate binding protein [Burkholderiales bacterium]|nr:tripartite tricarboxylate transporter substrate binding protein [Burkholderiales bacterium]